MNCRGTGCWVREARRCLGSEEWRSIVHVLTICGSNCPKMPKYVCGGGGSIVSSSFAFWSEIAPENACDIFSSLGISEGSLPASAGVSVGVSVGASVGVSVGKRLPTFSHP